jgi:hypothetical protein
VLKYSYTGCKDVELHYYRQAQQIEEHLNLATKVELAKLLE